MMIKIDEEKCIGCGTCEALCGGLFEMGSDNKARLKKAKQGNAQEKDIACAKQAAKACPVQCISIN